MSAVELDQPYRPALGDWVTVSPCHGQPGGTFQVVGLSRLAQVGTPLWVLAIPPRPNDPDQPTGPWPARWTDWLPGWSGYIWSVGRTIQAQARPATPGEIRAGQLEHLQAGGL